MKDEKYIKKACTRLNIPGHAHELTFTCFQKRKFLSKDLTRYFLCDAIILAKENHNFDLWAYVFMLDHVHLLIYPKNTTYSISKILQSIKQPVSRKAIEYLKENNPKGLSLLSTGQRHNPYRFWQDGGGYDRNVETEKTLINIVDYIHRNPERKRLVDNPGDWKWSSFGDWYGTKPGPIPINKDSFPL
jgi:REP-associated tyrosine transposase